MARVFPIELFNMLAECLGGGNGFAALAKLALASKAYYKITIPLVYRRPCLLDCASAQGFFSAIAQNPPLAPSVENIVLDPLHILNDDLLLPIAVDTLNHPRKLPNFGSLELTAVISLEGLEQLIHYFVPAHLVLPASNVPIFFLLNAVRTVFPACSFLEHIHLPDPKGHGGQFAMRSQGSTTLSFTSWPI